MSEQKVSGKTITHAWFRTTEMFKDDSVIGIAKQEWDDLDTRIDAALRRAKGEVLREQAKAMRHASVLYGNDMWRERKAVHEWADELDARAAQIEEGERNTARHRVDELEAREIDVEILQGDLTTLRQLAEAFTKTTKGKLTINRYEHGGGRMFVDDGKNRDLIADTYNEGDREFITLCYEVCATLAAKDAGKHHEVD